MLATNIANLQEFANLKNVLTKLTRLIVPNHEHEITQV